MNIPDSPADLRAPSLIQLGQRLLVMIGLVSFVVLSLWLWFSWEQTRENELARMARSTKLLAAHADNYFLSFELKTRSLARELRATDPARSAGDVLPLLRVFMETSGDIAEVSLRALDGRVLASTAERGADGTAPRTAPGPLPSRTEQRLLIQPPVQNRMQTAWMIPLQLVVFDAGQQARFFIEVGVALDGQQALWRKLAEGTRASLGLLRQDGYLISRLPDGGDRAQTYGKTVSGALYQVTRNEPVEGFYEGPVFTGNRRLGAFQRLSRLPVYAFMSESQTTLISLWWSSVHWPLVLALLSILMAAFLYVRLVRGYGARMRVIEEQMAFADDAAGRVVPSSGVQEIDMLVAALTQTHDKLRETARNRERLLLTAAEAGTYALRERDGVVLTADSMFCGMLGRSEADVIGRAWPELVEDRDLDNEPDLEGAGLSQRIITVQLPDDEQKRWLSVAEYREALLDGEMVRYGLAIDVSDREHLLNRVNLQSQRLQALWKLAMSRGRSDDEKMQLMLQLARDSLHMNTVQASELRDGRLVVRVSADHLGLFPPGRECASDDALCRESISSRECLVISDMRADPDLYRHPVSVSAGVRGFVATPIYAGSQLYGTMTFMRRQPLGQAFGPDERAFVELLAAWFGQLLLEEQHRAELERMAMTDALTRLANRRAAELRFQEEMARARRTQEIFSIAVCDLDRFKLINDQYGHDVGDLVLEHIADILRSHLREGDWAARWGGEEFIIFLHRAGTAEAVAAMERLRLAIRGNPVSTAHGPLHVTTSVGIGTYRGDLDLASILSEADGCLYEAKHAGRDTVVANESKRRGALWKAGMLQHALLENRIVPAYQPIVDLKTRQAVADEALARLVETDGRIVPAGEFIEVAEGTNFIHMVDETIARQTIRRFVRQAASGQEPPGFAHFVNLSSHFLARRDMVQSLLGFLREECNTGSSASLATSPIVLEITERQLLENIDGLVSDLQPLLDAGIRLALDDFGSGYSSFLYLASLPVSFLKIEGWMVANLRNNSKVLAMVQSTIALARDQDIITIAECIEDAETADILAELGVDWGQGWHFGRPQFDADPRLVVDPARTGTG